MAETNDRRCVAGEATNCFRELVLLRVLDALRDAMTVFASAASRLVEVRKVI